MTKKVNLLRFLSRLQPDKTLYIVMSFLGHALARQNVISREEGFDFVLGVFCRPKGTTIYAKNDE